MRRAGILMPVSSLPSPYGIGTMGGAAREFVDFLKAAGQSCWQILPTCPTGYGDSPYQGFSTFAGNPYFIDLEELEKDGLLKAEEYKDLRWGDDPARVDYGALYNNRFPVLRKACARLEAEDRPDYRTFCRKEKGWLEDYALYMALKGSHGGDPWLKWPEGERLRRPAALKKAREELKDEIAFWRGVQYLFFRQWAALKKYANAAGISIIGDLPIYVSADSSDVWANPGQFQLDAKGHPAKVAGVPPDAFSADGQLWGNPLFDWEAMKADGYRWWISRIAAQFKVCDILRIDHFRGFEAYFAIPAKHKNAKRGKWCPGPGADLFRAVEEALGKRAIIAEDLGVITQGVRDMLAEVGYPGMKVLEFAFDSRDGENAYLPHNYEKNCVVYAGTHDNDTVRGWLDNAPAATRRNVTAYFRLSEREGEVWGVMRGAWASPADLAVMQMQDLLGLGSEARLNTPSTAQGNWQWRALPGSYGPILASRVREEMRVYRRLPPVPAPKKRKG